MNAQAIVAIILSLVVVAFFALGVIDFWGTGAGISDEKTQIWAEIVMAVVGGLLVYVSTGTKD